jgi:hypothetical protein
MMAKKPGDRYRTPASVAAALASYARTPKATIRIMRSAAVTPIAEPKPEPPKATKRVPRLGAIAPAAEPTPEPPTEPDADTRPAV